MLNCNTARSSQLKRTHGLQSFTNLKKTFGGGKIRGFRDLWVEDLNAGVMMVPQLIPSRCKTSRPRSVNQGVLKDIRVSEKKIRGGVIRIKFMCKVRRTVNFQDN